MSETKPLTIDEVGFEPKKRFCEKHPGWQLRNVQDNPNGCDMAEDFRCPLCLRLELDVERKAHEQTREQLEEAEQDNRALIVLLRATVSDKTWETLCLTKAGKEFQQTREFAWELAERANALTEAMETCHICKGVIIVEEGPIHCEDCSPDCEEHPEPNCPSIEALHTQLKSALAKYHAQFPEEK